MNWPPIVPTDLIKQIDTLEMYFTRQKKWIRVMSLTPCQRRTAWELMLRDTFQGKILRRITRSDGPVRWTPKREDILEFPVKEVNWDNQKLLDLGCLYLPDNNSVICFEHTYFHRQQKDKIDEYLKTNSS